VADVLVSSNFRGQTSMLIQPLHGSLHYIDKFTYSGIIDLITITIVLTHHTEPALLEFCEKFPCRAFAEDSCMLQSYGHAMNRFFSFSSSPSSYLSPLPKSSANFPYLPNLRYFPPFHKSDKTYSSPHKH
jgi:hypothetical protein